MTGVSPGLVRSQPAPRGRGSRPGAWRWDRLVVPGIAASAGLAWVPFVGKQLSPDEGGFLLVASQWSPGTSLYGDYWVDRPPLLIALFGVADRLGGAVPLRLLGIGFVVVAVLLAGALGARASVPLRKAAVLPAAVAGIFLSTPLFGTAEVNGELLAVPFVLAGVLALVRSTQAESRASALPWAAAAGILAVGGAMVKQNVVDVFVFAAVVTVQWLWARREAEAIERLTAFVGGVVVATAAALGVAAWRGTGPAALWDAVIAFRFDAAEVIKASSSGTTDSRLHGLLVAFALSGAPVVMAAAGLRLFARRTPRSAVPDLRWPAVAVTIWEAVAVAAGGSYWWHYQIGLVPGLVLLVVAAGQRPRTRWTRVLPTATAYAAAAALVAVGWYATHVPTEHADAEVVAYLRGHGATGDSVVVAFGHPDIVEESGMSSPYSELWSLPVRVRDNHLTALTGVLEGHSRPTWVVVSGETLGTWGVDAGTAEAQLIQRYHRVASVGDYRIYRAGSETVKVAP